MDFQKTIKVKTTKEKAFTAVTQEINKWWGNVDTDQANEIGNEFSIYFENNTEWRFTITKLNKFNEVHWKCIYANHTSGDLNGITDEWLNSEVIFEFKDLGNDEVELFFKHKGLTPELNCYQMCDAGWTHFFANSLKQYLETGKGAPNLVKQ
ncbi:SRPBCC domain-containing protein [Flagellimonas meridianipacifica]|uniref:Activator of Hsp90 ATPase-like protein n=1 Tax=Flagellimonas meridianipacifica TaxID=1080225 RepID=A0A2T0MIS4_9FLAO|nr:SRPBCC domain-containing protein [Allomuricauda pacifica]PRX57406.1 activator of Hsp90 ATPase-like protein [Allomuricauda pacifica]